MKIRFKLKSIILLSFFFMCLSLFDCSKASKSTKASKSSNPSKPSSSYKSSSSYTQFKPYKPSYSYKPSQTSITGKTIIKTFYKYRPTIKNNLFPRSLCTGNKILCSSYSPKVIKCSDTSFDSYKNNWDCVANFFSNIDFESTNVDCEDSFNCDLEYSLKNESNLKFHYGTVDYIFWTFFICFFICTFIYINFLTFKLFCNFNPVKKFFKKKFINDKADTISINEEENKLVDGYDYSIPDKNKK